MWDFGGGGFRERGGGGGFVRRKTPEVAHRRRGVAVFDTITLTSVRSRLPLHNRRALHASAEEEIDLAAEAAPLTLHALHSNRAPRAPASPARSPRAASDVFLSSRPDPHSQSQSQSHGAAPRHRSVTAAAACSPPSPWPCSRAPRRHARHRRRGLCCRATQLCEIPARRRAASDFLARKLFLSASALAAPHSPTPTAPRPSSVTAAAVCSPPSLWPCVGVNWGTILPHTHAPRWPSGCG
uniref:Uncharacterized protein n=1 Tax=Oryza meridionalis TaxID=40149 RepID=A0A0E0DU65_9ORYZ